MKGTTGVALGLWMVQGALSRPLLTSTIRWSSQKPRLLRSSWQFLARGGAIPDDSTDDSTADRTSTEAALDDETPAPTAATPANGGRRTFLNTAFSSIQSQGRLNKLKRHVDALHPAQVHLNARKSVEHLKSQSQQLMKSAGPTVLSMLSPNEQGLLTARQIYALALLGSSCGFYLFLYFITVGYALGIALPIAVALILGNVHHSIPFSTNLQSSLIVLWGIRSAFYFMYREYINWPQLHEKVVQVDEMARLSSKLFCWLAYPLFYGTMMTPCLARLGQAAATTTTTANETAVTWGLWGRSGILLQFVGLLLETLADSQKSAFKSQPGNRQAWCNVGLWKVSTHPNYLGEHFFWLGTFIGGMGALHTKLQWLSSMVGLFFISVVLSGARSSLGSKHWRKYGNDVEFVEFRRTHWILGPIPGTKPHERRVSVI